MEVLLIVAYGNELCCNGLGKYFSSISVMVWVQKSPIGLCIETKVPQLVVLFYEVLEMLKGRA
jgi:hypothetical protein